MRRTEVAFQGERGAYSEEAVVRLFPRGEPVACRSMDEVFRQVSTGRCEYGVAPVENSHAGSINETHDLLLQYDLFVIAETIIEVNHCLLALPGERLESIRQVYSHPQALAQCASFICRQGLEAVALYDTAGSARMIAEKRMRGAAAIAGSRAAELYGLEILEKNIQSDHDNSTKFYVISTEEAPQSEPSVTALVMATPNTPGALYRCLGALAERGINLTRLESRPRRGRPWEYVFYVDCDGHKAMSPLKEALEELGRRASFLKVLGSFPRVVAR